KTESRTTCAYRSRTHSERSSSKRAGLKVRTWPAGRGRYFWLPQSAASKSLVKPAAICDSKKCGWGASNSHGGFTTSRVQDGRVCQFRHTRESGSVGLSLRGGGRRAGLLRLSS